MRGYSHEKMMEEEREGWVRTRMEVVGWDSVGPLSMEVWVSPPTRQRPHGMWIWYFDFFLGNSAIKWGWEASEKASACRHILKAEAALISWEIRHDLALPQCMTVTSLLHSHRTYVARGSRLSSVSRVLELSLEQPQWRFMPLESTPCNTETNLC